MRNLRSVLADLAISSHMGQPLVCDEMPRLRGWIEKTILNNEDLMVHLNVLHRLNIKRVELPHDTMIHVANYGLESLSNEQIGQLALDENSLAYLANICSCEPVEVA